MFKWLTNKIELFKLDRVEKDLEKEWKREQAEAKEKDDPALLEDWELNYADRVHADLRWSRTKLVSDALLREADEWHLPRPRYNDKTKWDEHTDEYGMPRGLLLTAEAITELRGAVPRFPGPSV